QSMFLYLPLFLSYDTVQAASTCTVIVLSVRVGREEMRMSEVSAPTDLSGEIAGALDEQHPHAKRQIRQVVAALGADTARALLSEVEHIEAHGGMLTIDQSRRR